jgi:hypothetical protein
MDVLSRIMDKTDLTNKFLAERTLIRHKSRKILTYALTYELFMELDSETMFKLSHSVARPFQAETM